MDILIHASAPEPVYEQIVRQIHDAVKSGALKTGAPLPTVRQLAGDLDINRNTVARAYRILEDQGVILTAGRKGTFVRQHAAQEVANVRTVHAGRLMGRVIRTLLGTGLSRRQITDIFNSALTLEARKGKS
jgi:GntR family transcriptional regulator